MLDRQSGWRNIFAGRDHALGNFVSRDEVEHQKKSGRPRRHVEVFAREHLRRPSFRYKL